MPYPFQHGNLNVEFEPEAIGSKPDYLQSARPTLATLLRSVPTDVRKKKWCTTTLRLTVVVGL